MATKQQFIDFFRTYNPSGGGAEEWNLWCQAFVSRSSKALGTFVRDYPTARAARLASGTLNGDLSKAPLGAIGWWEWGTQDHVAIMIHPGVWMMGSRHVTEQIGGVARNAGFVTHADFQARAGLKFLGWSATNGGNVIPVEQPAPGPKQRQVGPNGANARTEPRIIGARVKALAPNAIIDMQAFTDAGELVQGNGRWFQTAEGHWAWSGGFTSTAKANLADLTPPPPPPPPVFHSVTFDDGATMYVVEVEHGKTVAEPAELAMPGFTFEGWMLDNVLYDFSAPVEMPFLLEAAWERIPEPEPEPEPEPPSTDVPPNWFVAFLKAIVDAITKFLTPR